MSLLTSTSECQTCIQILKAMCVSTMQDWEVMLRLIPKKTVQVKANALGNERPRQRVILGVPARRWQNSIKLLSC